MTKLNIECQRAFVEQHLRIVDRRDGKNIDLKALFVCKSTLACSRYKSYNLYCLSLRNHFGKIHCCLMSNAFGNSYLNKRRPFIFSFLLPIEKVIRLLSLLNPPFVKMNVRREEKKENIFSFMELMGHINGEIKVRFGEIIDDFSLLISMCTSNVKKLEFCAPNVTNYGMLPSLNLESLSIKDLESIDQLDGFLINLSNQALKKIKLHLAHNFQEKTPNFSHLNVKELKIHSTHHFEEDIIKTTNCFRSIFPNLKIIYIDCSMNVYIASQLYHHSFNEIRNNKLFEAFKSCGNQIFFHITSSIYYSTSIPHDKLRVHNFVQTIKKFKGLKETRENSGLFIFNWEGDSCVMKCDVDIEFSIN